MRYHLFPFLIPKEPCWWQVQVGTGLQPNYKATENSWKNGLEILRKKWYQRIITQPWMGWEVHGTWDETKFYYWTPDYSTGERFHEAWSNDMGFVNILQENPPALDFGRPHSGAKLQFFQDFCVPIEIFSGNSVDSMTNLLQFMTYVDPGERAVVQMLIKPVYDEKVDKDFRRVLSKLQKGQNNANGEYVKAVMQKYQKPKAEIAIKLIYFADSQKKADSQMDQFVKAFSVFNSNKFNGFDRRRWWKIMKPLFRYEAKNRIFPMRRKQNALIMATNELASVARNPTSAGSSRFIRLRHQMPLSNIEARQEWKAADPSKTLYLGQNLFHFWKHDIYQSLSDAQKNTLVLGGPGMGKTMFLVNYMEQFLRLRTKENKYGLTVIDPNGTLTREILTRIPPEEQDRFRVYEFRKGNVPFNIYQNDSPISDNKKTRTAQGAIKKFDKSFWQPMVEENLLNAGIALSNLNMASTGNVQKLLENDGFRHHVMQLLDPNNEDQAGLIEYFRRYDEMDDVRQDFLKGTAMAKLRNLNVSQIGPMLNSHACAPSWFQSIEEGWIQVFDLSGLFPNEKQFLASVVFGFTQVAMHSRGGRPTEELPYHPLLVDDAAMLLQNHYDKMELYAGEATRQRIPFVFAVEGLSNLIKPEVMDSFFRNFGTFASFQAGSPTDAKIACANLNSFALKPEDYNSVEPGNCYMQMPMGEDRTRVFYVKPNQLDPGPYADRAEELRKATVAYGEAKEAATRTERENQARERLAKYQAFLQKTKQEKTDSAATSDHTVSTEEIVTRIKPTQTETFTERKAEVPKTKASTSDEMDEFIDLLYGMSSKSKKAE
ncbi:type IV secretory system conjugative DNA transfer family protein [Risungbinella massiliensis]|uniref:hypothetical protein n=1 Tax=Risungbinella massiliensis TaxID=1329796 RepID=UPI0005CBA46A|nr:hypothetical protein [Risungbinella massiliensis]